MKIVHYLYLEVEKDNLVEENLEKQENSVENHEKEENLVEKKHVKGKVKKRKEDKKRSLYIQLPFLFYDFFDFYLFFCFLIFILCIEYYAFYYMAALLATYHAELSALGRPNASIIISSPLSLSSGRPNSCLRALMVARLSSRSA